MVQSTHHLWKEWVPDCHQRIYEWQLMIRIIECLWECHKCAQNCHIMIFSLSPLLWKLSVAFIACGVCSCSYTFNSLFFCFNKKSWSPFFNFSINTVFSVCTTKRTSKTHSQPAVSFAAILPTPPTPSYSSPSSLLFSWSLHSTPPLQTGHKRAEHATPDLWQTFQSCGPFHTAKSPLSFWQRQTELVSFHILLNYRMESLNYDIYLFTYLFCLLTYSHLLAYLRTYF